MFPLWLIEYHATQNHGKLAADLGRGECTDSAPDRFILGKTDPGIC